MAKTQGRQDIPFLLSLLVSVVADLAVVLCYDALAESESDFS
jgi:hypothetical protein